MLQPLLIVCFLVVFLRDGLGEPWVRGLEPWESAVITLGSMAGLAALAAVLVWGYARHLDRAGDFRIVRRADRVLVATWVLAGVVHVAAVLAFGWLDAVRAVTGNLVGVDEALAVAPVLGVVIAGWWSIYPIDRRLREAGLIRDLDEGKPVYSFLSRNRFVLMAVRHHLAIVVVPILLVIAWAEGVNWAAAHWFGLSPLAAQGGAEDAPWRAAGNAAALMIVLVQAAGTLGVFTVMPPIMRRVWDTIPLGEGPMRSRLIDLCARHGVRIRELLVWRTQGTMINGAVMGLFPPVRYILLTDSLLDHLSDRQVEAVMAHEVGHIRRRHMLWLIVAMLAGVGAVIALAQVAVGALHLPASVMRWADVPITLCAAGAAFILFGFVSRRFEWQADAFAVRHLSGPTITPAAVEAMNSALQVVADANHVPADRFSFRHGSIRSRQERLFGLVGLPADRLPVDRTAARLKAASALGLLAAGALAALTIWP